MKLKKNNNFTIEFKLKLWGILAKIIGKVRVIILNL